jgi:hypothetical protein
MCRASRRPRPQRFSAAARHWLCSSDDDMVVRILLLAGEAPAETVEISRTIVLDARGPEWQRELVSAIGDHARDTALCLLDQIAPALPGRDGADTSFVPLAHVLPSCG